MPRWPDKQVDTAQEFSPQEKSVILPASGSIVDVVEDLKDIQVAEKPLTDDYAAALAFMEEKLLVVINEESDPNAENPVQVACNGINQFFLRGQPHEVKRKYVEILARAKRTSISTPEVTDATGARTHMIKQSTSLRYPFQVLQDPNPKGPTWLRSILSEAH
jgi:hypothetical protein